SSLNLMILLASAAILFWSLVLWPLSPLLRRGEPAPSAASPTLRRLRLYLHGAALFDALFLVAWTATLLPALSYQLQVYSYRLAPVVLTLEIAGLLTIVAAVGGLWAAWRLFKEGAPLLSRIWS